MGPCECVSPAVWACVGWVCRALQAPGPLHFGLCMRGGRGWPCVLSDGFGTGLYQWVSLWHFPASLFSRSVGRPLLWGPCFGMPRVGARLVAVLLGALCGGAARVASCWGCCAVAVAVCLCCDDVAVRPSAWAAVVAAAGWQLLFRAWFALSVCSTRLQ